MVTSAVVKIGSSKVKLACGTKRSVRTRWAALWRKLLAAWRPRRHLAERLCVSSDVSPDFYSICASLITSLGSCNACAEPVEVESLGVRFLGVQDQIGIPAMNEREAKRCMPRIW